MRIVRAGKEMAEKNGDDPWIFHFREAWLRTLALDYSGARRLGELVKRAKGEYLTGQPQTIARIAGGIGQ